MTGVAAHVRDEVITVAEVHARLAELRAGPLAGRLPHPDGPEGRNVRRWLVQVMAAERLVRQENLSLARDSIRTEQTPDRTLSPSADETLMPPPGQAWPPLAGQAWPPPAGQVTGISLELAMRAGGVTAAVLASPAGLALFQRVTGDILADETEISDYYARNPDRFAIPETRRTREFGPVRRGELTGPIEDAVFAAAPGDVVGPIDGPGGPWTLTVERVDAGGREPYQKVREEIGRELTIARREQVFARWLEARLARCVRLSPGFEHPGDPRQPDVTHRH
ncbi:malonyl CoA-ACP transacylase [Acrocarpospora corrugata]|uniref:Malonyl CoA-ACP transacylase n=1 Tax=Acrocarpospora corrugata TaxID=35763 RepID=A0A5M3W5C5_9ACTN|nr:peptidylprolyl isomerase [Acrocarpospora corrugata]GES01738.1 malonyl CoA-ACP transacylase [Acrocarpospora corrugata]